MADRILVLRLGALGDVADTGPAVLRLRELAPQAHITWIVKRGFATLVEPWCDEVLSLPSDIKGWPGFLKKLMAHRWDLCVDFHGNFRSGLIAFLSGSSAVVGYEPRLCKEHSDRFYTHHVRVPEDCRSRLDQGLCLVQTLGGAPGYVPPPFPENLKTVRFADTTLAEGHDLILVAGMSKRGRFKSWPAERWRRFIEITEPNKYLLIWGPGERDYVEAIARGFGDRVRVGPKTRLTELVALLRRSRAVIGADTGPMHIAHLLGRPTVVLFGPKDPSHYGPQYNEHRILWNRQSCSPCRNWRCDHVSCMWSLGSEDVKNEVLSLVGSHE